MAQSQLVIFHASEKIIISLILTVLIAGGITGNIIVCIVFAQNKNIQTPTNYLIVSLAVADVMQSATMIFMIKSLLSGGWELGSGVCQLTGFMNISFIITSLISLAMISLQRYFAVVRTTKRTVFSRRSTCCLIAFSWLFPAALAISPVLGWSAYEYRPGKLMCTLQFSYNISFTLTVCFSGLLVPFATICFSTYKILKTVRESGNRVSSSELAVQQRRKNESRVSIMLVSVVVSFLIFYLPAAIINCVQLGYGDNYNIPFRADVWTVIIAMFNHANNPVIYGLLNPNFRKAFKTICSKEKRNQIRNNTVVNTEIK